MSFFFVVNILGEKMYIIDDVLHHRIVKILPRFLLRAHGRKVLASLELD